MPQTKRRALQAGKSSKSPGPEPVDGASCQDWHPREQPMLNALFRVMRSGYKPEIASLIGTIEVYDSVLSRRRKGATPH
jgi:hypothetical protein